VEGSGSSSGATARLGRDPLQPHPHPAPTHAPPQVNGWKLATTINMCIIFFIFGITLDTSELKSAVKAWKAILYGPLVALFTGCMGGGRHVERCTARCARRWTAWLATGSVQHGQLLGLYSMASGWVCTA
jgi:hypothetical protein